LQRLGMSKSPYTPLHSQSDGMFERYIKTAEELLLKVVSSQQRDWHARFLCPLAYRAFTHDTTCLTPASLVFGIDLRLPCDLLFGEPLDKERPTIDHAANFADHLHIHNYARQHLKLASNRMKTHYDRLTIWVEGTMRATDCRFTAQPARRGSRPRSNHGRARTKWSPG
jgi:hypothetical protein